MAKCTLAVAVELQLHGASTITCLSTVTVTYPGQETSLNCLLNYQCYRLVELPSSLMTGTWNYLVNVIGVTYTQEREKPPWCWELPGIVLKVLLLICQMSAIISG